MTVLVKVKRCDWIDLKSGVTFFGIKGQTSDGRWYNLTEGSEALVFANHHERDAKMKEIRKKAAEQRAEPNK